ncbi:MAG: hypothetical protein ACHQT7_02705 [Candidatus Levyibacteriota bacterium]
MELRKLSPIRRMPAEEAKKAEDRVNREMGEVYRNASGPFHFSHADKIEMMGGPLEEYNRQRPVKLAGEWVLKPFWRRQGKPRVRYFKQ